MIEDRIRKIQERIIQADNLSPESREELLTLLSALKEEVRNLPEEASEDLQSLGHFTEATAYEATRKARRPDLLESALNGLSDTVEEFEVSHPDLAATVNRIATILSGMGM